MSQSVEAAFIRKPAWMLPLGWVMSILRFSRDKPMGGISLFLIGLLLVTSAFATWIAPYDPLEPWVAPAISAPSWSHWFGTDTQGRDVLSRLIHGGRVVVTIGFISVAISATTGTLLGIASGYYGRGLDMLLQRIVDAFQAFPTLILALAVISVLGASVVNMILTIIVVLTPGTIRIVRGMTLSVREGVYIEAARAVGASDARIITRHILPNVLAPVLVIVSVEIGAVVLIISSLSFLGLGLPPPRPDWGAMLSLEGREALETAPWLGMYPGLFITLTILSFNLLGDALRDVWDPRLRGGTKVTGRRRGA